MSEALVLTLPNEPRFFAVVRLVVSGLAAQLDLRYDQIDDLQLAVEGALTAGQSQAAGEVTLRIEPRGEALSVSINPVGARRSDDLLGFERIAAELVDTVEIVSIEGSDWLRLEKRIQSTDSV